MATKPTLDEDQTRLVTEFDEQFEGIDHSMTEFASHPGIAALTKQRDAAPSCCRRRTACWPA